jgi:4-alpha-glucanotransferase
MTYDSISFPPFPSSYRASGLLMHVTSLPSPYGIGDVGPGAIAWIDRLQEAGQSWWQRLPLGPTGYGNSPYQPLSSFACNELIVSPDWLIEDGLLQVSEAQTSVFRQHEVDYDVVIPFKHEVLAKAWKRFKSGARSDLRPALEQFCFDQAHWLDDYALFRALKIRFAGAYYLEWPAELVQRQAAALDRARKELADQVSLGCFVQFLLFRQTERLKAYAHRKGVNLIGDLPFFVSPDASDVWANPELFLLDERHRPRFVAGVPPDYFSAKGQLWGNPVYDWDALRGEGYGWWIRRLRSLLSHVDVIRLDHFRGFTAAWHVNAGAGTAEVGEWKPGPGAEFFSAVRRELGHLPFIAEDLGQITPEVYTLGDHFQLPGMRVLQFAFDGYAGNPHLPNNYFANIAVYTGTHDNPPTRGWFEDLPEDQKRICRDYLRGSLDSPGGAAAALMGLAWSSAGALAMAPLQDLLNLGNEARMNVPGRADGNWGWRCTADSLSGEAFERIRELTKSSNRLTAIENPAQERELEAVSR